MVFGSLFGGKKQKLKEQTRQLAADLQLVISEEPCFSDLRSNSVPEGGVVGTLLSVPSLEKRNSEQPDSARVRSLLHGIDIKKYGFLEEFLQHAAAYHAPQITGTTRAKSTTDSRAASVTPSRSNLDDAKSSKPPKHDVVDKFVLVSKQVRLLDLLVECLPRANTDLLTFVSSLWGWILRLHNGRSKEHAYTSYLASNAHILKSLITAYKSSRLFMHVGVMIRDAIRHRELAENILESSLIEEIFTVLKYPNIDMTTDAFETLRELLVTHKSVSSTFLLANYESFFSHIRDLLSADYMTVRQTLKLLTEVTLDRAFMDVMLRFVNDEQQLMCVMKLLTHKHQTIQNESFHIFKIFAANPKKAPKIHRILWQNKDRLVRTLDAIADLKKSKEDQVFANDKATVVHKLTDLPKPDGVERQRSKLTE